MDNLNFGVTMLVVGMGGTLLTLWILTLVIDLLRVLFPPEPREPEKDRHP